METIFSLGFLLVGVLSQVLFWGGLIFGFLFFFRFEKIRDWFNKKAGEQIVETFSFRTLRTVVLSIVIGWAIAMGSLLLLVALFEDYNPTQDQSLMMAAGVFALCLIYPSLHLIRRIMGISKAENKKAAKWKFFYDLMVNITFAMGGWGVASLILLATVLMSLTKWSRVMPERWRAFTGVDVVPPSTKFYWIGAVGGAFAVITQFICGSGSEEIIGGTIVVVGLAALAYAAWCIYSTAPEQKKQVAWQWAYRIAATYIVFLLSAFLIFSAIILLILYIILQVAGGSSHGKDRYEVTCNHLTDDVINGRGICEFTNSRCQMRDTGTCPYQ